ncbi:MAG: SEC-C domain-containing protein [Campylobacterales bacterium]|nr:SEC-C domain-containing protein [Campylobacterales bacterium]
MCICGLDKEFLECCGGLLLYNRQAQTPEELMRSRYSAYVRGDAKYLLFTTVKENRYEDDLELIEEFATKVEWLKLDVLNAIEDTVEFKAYYKDVQSIQLLHEKSNFIKEDGLWKYKDGELYKTKIERNEACPCGSGKKYKKCCG